MFEDTLLAKYGLTSVVKTTSIVYLKNYFKYLKITCIIRVFLQFYM